MSGSRGSWNSWMWRTDHHGASATYHVSLVPRSMADRWFRLRRETEEWVGHPGEMGRIHGVVETWREDGGERAAVRVGAGVTNHQLIAWGRETGWSLGSNVVIERATVGGTVTTLSHGGGAGCPTVADYVMEVEYVDGT